MLFKGHGSAALLIVKDENCWTWSNKPFVSFTLRQTSSDKRLLFYSMFALTPVIKAGIAHVDDKENTIMVF